MIIDGDTGRYGSMLILSELPNDPENAIREIIDTFSITIDENWYEFLETEGVSSVDEIYQSRELTLLIDLSGVDNAQVVIDSLSHFKFGTYEKTIELIDSSKTQLTVEITLILEGVDDLTDDFDDNSDPTVHYEARFRTAISVNSKM